MSATLSRSFEHVTARHARRLLVAGDPPSHAILDLAYQEAISAAEDDELNPAINTATLDARWAATTNLSPGCTIEQRMQALRKFWSA